MYQSRFGAKLPRTDWVKIFDISQYSHPKQSCPCSDSKVSCENR